MRVILLFVLLLLSLVSISGQTVARRADAPKPGAPDESAIAALQPELTDTELAAKQGFQVFKILPRGMHASENNAYGLRGGGAYYSFTKKSHSYNEMPQIGLEKGRLDVAFYGANYGFLKDLGTMDLTSVGEAQKEVVFLAGYTPPLYEPDVRQEQRKSHDYLVDGINYKRNVEAVSGHTYVLRAIGFREADTLVAFNIHRINEDGSMIVFWKPIKDFGIPKLLYAPDAEIKAKVDEILKDPNYVNVTSRVDDNRITLQGQVADAEHANLIRKVVEIQSMGVNNQVMKKRD
jgi:hypothetical protein